MTMNRSRPLDRRIRARRFFAAASECWRPGRCSGPRVARKIESPLAAADPVSANIAKLSDLTGVFMPAWTSPAVANAHFNTMSTPHGPGWTFTCADTDIAPWDSRSKAILAQYHPETIGTEVRWTFYLNLPTQTFLPHWFCGVLWEFHTNSSAGHGLSIDVTSNPQPCFKILRDDGGPLTSYYTYPSFSTTGIKSSWKSNGLWDRTAIYGGLSTARNGWTIRVQRASPVTATRIFSSVTIPPPGLGPTTRNSAASLGSCSSTAAGAPSDQEVIAQVMT